MAKNNKKKKYVVTKEAIGANGFDKILKQELQALEGIQSQHPETGSGINSGKSYLKQYTNRIFGAPFQFMDSVDRRFPNVNPNVGNEYLRNIILNSPILHIKPGMPIYTGGTATGKLLETVQSIYGAAIRVNAAHANSMSYTDAVLTEIARDTIFKSGEKLQKRMFGFRETYYQYMSNVNYMCRSMATFLNLTKQTSNQRFPTGTYIGDNNKFAGFSYMKWEKYRMLTKSKPMSPTKEFKKMFKATLIGAGISVAGKSFKEMMELIGDSAKITAEATAKMLQGDDTALDRLLDSIGDAATEHFNEIDEYADDAVKEAKENTVVGTMIDKVCSVLFMVEPTQFDDVLTNTTKESLIESGIDGMTDSVGSEIAFITGSNASASIIGNMTEFLGDTVQTAGNFLSGLIEPVAGGFASNLFNGALKSVKGQKMIYPKIYSKSTSETNYSFTVKLSTPYGDVYNYYMNIIVPLMHLIALAAPRMISSNAVASPFLVQAFIPGQCTCQLGIISQMTIQKNPEVKHVSVQGFPLDVTVKFTIEELYNALSISPANDPSSFLFNETLNDYMSNLAGLQPSVDTYKNQQTNAFEALNKYFTTGEYLEDAAADAIMKIENLVYPFLGR